MIDYKTLRVYQAFSSQIALHACSHQRLDGPMFSMSRMAWIKPSFLWMMYRSGWATKDANQAHILAIDVTQEGFKWALSHACESSYSAASGLSKERWRDRLHSTPVRLQWDPERDIDLRPLSHRSLQVGLRDEALHRYVSDWTVRISDVTDRVYTIYSLVKQSRKDDAQKLLPEERPFLLPDGDERP